MIVAILLGAVFATLLILFARWRGPRRQNVVLAIGLVVTALLYVGFAVVGAASAKWLAIEVAGVFPFTLLAWLGIRGSSAWIALGWLLHVVWDTALHLGAQAPSFVSPFFPTFCIGFDLVVAGYIAGQLYALRASRPEAA